MSIPIEPTILSNGFDGIVNGIVTSETMAAINGSGTLMTGGCRPLQSALRSPSSLGNCPNKLSSLRLILPIQGRVSFELKVFR